MANYKKTGRAALALAVGLALPVFGFAGCVRWPGIDNQDPSKHAGGQASAADASAENALVEKIRQRDGTNYIGVFMGMIAEWDGCTSRYHPPTNYIGGVSGLEFADEGWMETNAHPQGVMMFSATSGELLKWISAESFTNIFILKTQPEYP